MTDTLADVKVMKKIMKNDEFFRYYFKIPLLRNLWIS